ncbi:hypothetical protein LHP98_12295 [Rhodobacter sp. Har01]|uniref:hypothetical protein n=1 Tax=Rhodobacter sp. Har01 TaxID=2883999 RepID=UPI001D06E594|nr:hypothetical protein [Rhodobacter sp. Har01]MCB6178907.1 hypothetical protein [Rhodobacter sp. Har01]
MKAVVPLLAALLAPPALAQEIVFTPEEPAGIAGYSAWQDAQGRVPGATYGYGAADLDGDGVDEALVKITEPTWCNGDMEHCRVVIVRQEGETWETYGYPYAKTVTVLETVTNGWKDLQIDDHVEVKGEGQGIHYMLKP